MTKLVVDRNLRAASHTLLFFTLVGTSAATYVTGGLRGSNVLAFVILMMTSVFLLGRRGLVWSISALAVAVAFHVGHWLGCSYPDTVPPDQRSVDDFLTWFSACAVVLGLALLYDRTRELTLHRLEEADRAKTRFIASLSHEIRTPIHVIMGMHQMLDRTALDERQREHLVTARQNSKILLALIDDLLDASSLEVDKLVLRPCSFVPRSMFDDVSGVIEYAAREKGLGFEKRVQPGVPERVRADRRRIVQVLMNLAGNAVKFTREGTVVLGMETDAGSHLVFTVEDTGPGIPEGERERVFRSFTQSRHETVEGAGMGLFISRQIVEHMGGTLEMDSEVGRGSTFVVRVPVEVETRDAAA
jgi:signal transduction histidine kinase